MSNPNPKGSDHLSVCVVYQLQKTKTIPATATPPVPPLAPPRPLKPPSPPHPIAPVPSSAVNTANVVRLAHTNRTAEGLTVGPKGNGNSAASVVTKSSPTELRNGKELARLATPRVGSGSDSKASEYATKTDRENPDLRFLKPLIKQESSIPEHVGLAKIKLESSIPENVGLVKAKLESSIPGNVGTPLVKLGNVRLPFSEQDSAAAKKSHRLRKVAQMVCATMWCGTNVG